MAPYIPRMYFFIISCLEYSYKHRSTFHTLNSGATAEKLRTKGHVTSNVLHAKGHTNIIKLPNIGALYMKISTVRMYIWVHAAHYKYSASSFFADKDELSRSIER